MMITSSNGIRFIKGFEKFRGKAYPDSGGTITIGWGTTLIYGHKVQLGMEINELVADVFFAHDLGQSECEVNKLINVKLNQNQFDALVSFQYNTGALGTSTLLKMINWSDGIIVENLFTRWNKAHVSGKLVTLDGLTKRRLAEFNLYHAKNKTDNA